MNMKSKEKKVLGRVHLWQVICDEEKAGILKNSDSSGCGGCGNCSASCGGCSGCGGSCGP